MKKTNFDIYQWFLLVPYTLNIKKYEYPNGYSYFLVRETEHENLKLLYLKGKIGYKIVKGCIWVAMF